MPQDLQLQPQIYESQPVGSLPNSGRSMETSISSQDAELLPKGLNFSSVLKINPNTRPEARSGQVQVDGASGTENTYIVDGQETTRVSDALTRANSGVATAASGDEIGDLFEYRIDRPVTVNKDGPL